MRPIKSFHSIGLFIILVVVGVVAISIPSQSGTTKKTIFIATLEYHPWTGKRLKFDGFVNHVVAEAFQRAGYAVRYTYLPWKRALGETRKGKYSALSYVYYSKDRDKEFYLSDPISSEKIVLFHLKSRPISDWKTLDDLKEYKIGATRGYTYSREFWQAAESRRLNVDVTDNDIQNFKKLFAGRIDIFPSGLVNGYRILQKEFEPGKSDLLTYHLKPLSNTTGRLAFTKSRDGSETLLQAFNNGLAKLKKEGLYDQYRDDLLEGKYSP